MQLQNPRKLLNCSSVTHVKEIAKMRYTHLNLLTRRIHTFTWQYMQRLSHATPPPHTHTNTHTLAQGCVVGSHQHNPFTGDKKGFFSMIQASTFYLYVYPLSVLSIFFYFLDIYTCYTLGERHLNMFSSPLSSLVHSCRKQAVLLWLLGLQWI